MKIPPKVLTVITLICCYCCSGVASDSLEAFRTSAENSSTESFTSTLIDWLFRAYTSSFDSSNQRETGAEKLAVPHMNPMRQANLTGNRNGRQIVLGPADLLLLQQQRQQQAIAAAQLQQQIIRNNFNQFVDDDSSEEDDDFDSSNDFFEGPPSVVRRRIIPGIGLGFRSDMDETVTEDNSSDGSCTCPPTASTKPAGSNPATESTMSSGTSTTGSTLTQKTSSTAAADSGSSTTSGSSSTESTTSSEESSSTSAESTSTTDSTTTSRPKKPPYKANIDCRCGTQTTKDVLLGSIYVQTNVYPWVVSINSNSTHLCTGNIINSKFVLTAASCLNGSATEDLRIQSTLTAENRTVYTVDKVHYHPAYNNSTWENNIALLEINEVFRPSKIMKFICLPIGHNMQAEAGITVTLAKSQIDSNLTLIQENVQEIRQNRCKTLIKRQKGKLPKNSFCTAPPRKECHGDSGGSFITHGKGYSFVLKGLISTSSGCKRRAQPTVHTMVGKYINWILYKTQKASYCKEPDFASELRNHMY